MLDVISHKGLPVQQWVPIRQQLLDRTMHPRRGRVEMCAEEANDQDSWSNVLSHHPVLHTLNQSWRSAAHQ